MTGFEYKVVPAPTRGLKAKGVKGTPARFANALQTVMNELGAEGWEYQRTDTLPVEERQGLTGKTSTFQNMLVFRRTLPDAPVEAPEVAALIEDQSDVIEENIEDVAAETEVPADEGAVDAPEGDAEPAEDRVKETLEADGFTFPWNKRGKAAKSDNDETQLPAE